MKRCLILLLSFCLFFRISAQVNLQTGSAVFNLPVFNWQDAKSRLNTTLELNYNSGNGLQVNSVASSIGTGWNLAAGGVITRMQVGEPDDQKPRDANVTDVTGHVTEDCLDLTKYPAGYEYNLAISQGNIPNYTDRCPLESYLYPLFYDQGTEYTAHNSITADREPDYFSFQFNGRSGLFAIGKIGDICRTLGDSKLKIWFERDDNYATQNHIRTNIITFHIQDENGLIYTFGQVETEKLLKTQYGTAFYPLNPPDNYADGQKYFEFPYDNLPIAANPYIISGWYLTEIKDPLTNRTVSFNYTMRHINSSNGDDIRTKYSLYGDPSYSIVTHKVSVTETPVISSIVYPDGNMVTFRYDMNKPRTDLTGDYPIKAIDMTLNGKYISSYQFATTYFIGNSYGTPATSDEKSKARLCLKSIMQVGVNLKENTPPYTFDYYTGSSAADDFVPPPFFYAKDIWGYYNGDAGRDDNNMPIPTNTTIGALNYHQLKGLCFTSNPYSPPSTYYTAVKNGYAKNGLLKTITYPAGGSLTYSYMQNYPLQLNGAGSPPFALGGTPTPGGSITIQPGGVFVSQTSVTDGGYSNDNTKSIVTTYKYKTADDRPSQWGVELPYTGMATTSWYAPDGKRVGFGSCTYDYTFPGNVPRASGSSINGTGNFLQSFLQAFNIVSTASSFALDIITLLSTSNPEMLIADVFFFVVGYIITCANPPDSWEGDEVFFTNNNIYGRNALPVQFKRVEVVQTSENKGKTIYEFTGNDPDDYPLWDYRPFDPSAYNERHSPYDIYSMKQRAAIWAYGLPKVITIMDANGNPVKQTINVYDYSKTKTTIGFTESCNCTTEFFSAKGVKDWNEVPHSLNWKTASVYNYDPYYSYALKVDPYSLYTGRVELSDTYERTFEPNNPAKYTETKTHYDYDAINYQVNKISTTESNGDTYIKEMYYTADNFSVPLAFTLSQTYNVVNLPVAVYQSVKKGNALSYTSAEITDFTNTSNGDIKPLHKFVGRSSTPITGYTINTLNPFDYPNLTQVSSSSYDQQGNLVGITTEGGHTVSNIYDYDGKYITASVVNAVPNIDKAAYTSFETNETGGWTLNGSLTFSQQAVTGTRSLTMSSSNTLTANLNTAKGYKLSFWATGNLIVSGGVTLKKTAPTINGFTYYEYEINQNTSAISITGSATIDEVRLYPSTARMRTVAYDPILGKTATCDENNRVVYYEYDNLARLRYVRDEYKNILKMYDYNIIQSGTIGTADLGLNAAVIYAKLITEAYPNGNNSDTYGNVFVSFFSDEACTIPFTVENLQVNYNQKSQCTKGLAGVNNNYSKTVSGSTKILLMDNAIFSSNVQTGGEDHNSYCTYTYTLSSGNYLIK